MATTGDFNLAIDTTHHRSSAADVRGASMGAHLSIGSIDVHTFPH